MPTPRAFAGSCKQSAKNAVSWRTKEFLENESCEAVPLKVIMINKEVKMSIMWDLWVCVPHTLAVLTDSDMLDGLAHCASVVLFQVQCSGHKVHSL